MPSPRRSPWLIMFGLGACTPHAPRDEQNHVDIVQPQIPARVDPEPPPAPRPEPAPEPAPARRPDDNCFGERRDRPLPYWPLNGVLADLDGDGRRDLVVNFSLEATAGILLHDGDGGFREPALFKLRHDAVGLAVGDLDGDARLDLVAADYAGTAIRVHRGLGDGRFADEPRVTDVGKYLNAGPSVDLDGDGHRDLVVTLWAALGVLRGRGDGSFAAARRYPAGQAPSNPLALDLDRDGRLDLAVASNDHHHLSVFRGRAKGQFAAVKKVPCGAGGHKSVAGDFDGDGDLDLAMVNTHSDDVCIFHNDGAGDFSVGARVPAGASPNALDLADLDGDGVLDLVVVAWYGDATRKAPEQRDIGTFLGDGALFVFAGDGKGDFRPLTLHPVGHSPTEVWLGDIDHDGVLDALTLNSNGRSLTQLRGLGCRQK